MITLTANVKHKHLLGNYCSTAQKELYENFRFNIRDAFCRWLQHNCT